jgi:hypothetical protein
MTRVASILLTTTATTPVKIHGPDQECADNHAMPGVSSELLGMIHRCVMVDCQTFDGIDDLSSNQQTFEIVLVRVV